MACPACHHAHIEGSDLDGRQHESGDAHGTRKSEAFMIRVHNNNRPEVTQLDCATAPNQHVLRLHVAVDDAIGVQVVKGGHKLLGDGADLH